MCRLMVQRLSSKMSSSALHLQAHSTHLVGQLAGALLKIEQE